MTLNGIMAVALRDFTQFGKPEFEHITASIFAGIYAPVYCIRDFVFALYKFTFSITITTSQSRLLTNHDEFTTITFYALQSVMGYWVLLSK